jgi:hypothetical protein
VKYRAVFLISMISSREMGGHTACTGVKRSVCRVLCGKTWRIEIASKTCAWVGG